MSIRVSFTDAEARRLPAAFDGPWATDPEIAKIYDKVFLAVDARRKR